MSVLSKPYFHDEAEAFRYLESVIWADGIVCPHCGATDRITEVKANAAKRIRMGLKRCGHCKGQFTVKVGTVFEHARMPLNKMLQAVYLMSMSKKGISAHQLHRALEVTYKTAWFLAHRIREAMRSGDLAPFGSGGTPVEVDETYIGREPGTVIKGGGVQHKMKVLSLIDRATGRARSMVIDNASIAVITPIVRENIVAEAKLMTDDAGAYRHMHKHFAFHGFTQHNNGEYVRGDVHTNTVEGYFSIFKRGMKGVYQHCGKKHLHRYLAEFDFRYSNRAALGVDDKARTVEAIKGITGKRLTYRRPDHRAEA